MTEKIAPGVTHEASPHPRDGPGDGPEGGGPDRNGLNAGGRRFVDHAEEQEAFRARRDASRWNLVVGTGLLFMGGFHVGFAVGGVLMILYGGGSYVYWSTKMRRAYDPWKDPELDAWEEEYLR